MKKINDENFIAELRKGNELAMHYVIDKYSWIIKTVISRNLTVLPNLKSECMNDCLMSIWENISQYDENRSDFKNWVGGIAKYKCIDYKRKYVKELSNVSVDDIEIVDERSVDEAFIREEIQKEIQQMLAVLSDIDRKIFIKFYFEDMKVSEICKDVGLSDNVVYMRLSRGRKKIKNEFKFGERCSNE